MPQAPPGEGTPARQARDRNVMRRSHPASKPIPNFLESRENAMKTCARCQTAKSRDQFNRYCRSPDGLQGYCKPCMKAYAADRYGYMPTGRKIQKGVITTYGSAHMAVKRRRGSASKYACAECQGPAQDWSYKGGSPNERRGPVQSGAGVYEAAYSTDVADYEPRCKPCHRAYDRKLIGA